MSSTRIEPPEDLYHALVRDNFLATPAVVVRKVCYDRLGGFDPRLRIAEDYDMWLRLASTYRLEGIPCPLVRVRVHSANTMSDVDLQCQSRLMIAAKHFGRVVSDGCDLSEGSREAHGYALRAVAIRYIGSGEMDRGWLYLAKAATIYPPVLAQLDTFYELVLGDQPRGHRGDVSGVNTETNGREMVLRLATLLASADESVQSLRGQAYGNAYLALAMLSDQAGQWRAARRYMLKAIRQHPILMRQTGVARRLAKLFAGRRLIAWLKGLTRRSNDQTLKDWQA